MRERNNSRSGDPFQCLPDLIVSSLGLDSVTVANIGRGDSGPSIVTIGGLTLSVPALGVGEEVQLTYQCVGGNVTAFADAQQQVAELIARGYSMEVSSRLLAASALIALPTVFAVAWIYHAWSTKYALISSIAITILGLGGVLWLALTSGVSPVPPIALLIVGSNGIIAMLLPYAAESFPLRIRGRTTGWIAACSKLGGVFAQALSILAIIPTLAATAALIALPTALSLLLLARFGKETKGRDLRDLDPDGHIFEATGL